MKKLFKISAQRSVCDLGSKAPPQDGVKLAFRSWTSPNDLTVKFEPGRGFPNDLQGALFLFLLQFRWFQVEVLQAMEKNVKLDEEYIDVSVRGRGAWPITDTRLNLCACVYIFYFIQFDFIKLWSKTLFRRQFRHRSKPTAS